MTAGGGQRTRRRRVHSGRSVSSFRGAANATLGCAVQDTRPGAIEVLGQRTVHDGGRAVRAAFQRPLLNGAVNQPEVVDTGVLPSRFTGLDEVRDGNRGQETDDCDHDHDFNEREARLA